MMTVYSFAVFIWFMLQICCINGFHSSIIGTATSLFAFRSATRQWKKKNSNINIFSDNERQQKLQTILFSSVRRYGPPNNSNNSSATDDGNINNNSNDTDLQLGEQPSSSSSSSSSNNDDTINIKKGEFKNLVDKVIQIPQPEHIPRLLVNNIELILGLQKEDGAQVISSVVEDAKQNKMTDDDDDDDDDDDRKNDNGSSSSGVNDNDIYISGDNSSSNDSYYVQTIQAVEMILSFAEDFVKEAQGMDANNKKLLGKIIKSMVTSDNDKSIAGETDGDRKNDDSSSGREEALDRLMQEEKENFTAGFLRHIEGECDRIMNAPRITPESTRLLEIMRLIQVRVLEELGQDLGQAALVLGQLIGYDKDDELLGVLDAGLQVQGTDFALEMKTLVEEALGGFKQIPGGGADPDLVRKVNLIDKRLHQVLDEYNEFQ